MYTALCSGLQLYIIYSFLFKIFRSRRMEQALLASSNVVQYGNQNTIVFVLPPALPEIRDFLMNGGGLLPVKAGMKQSSVYMFKQSCLRVWDVLQSIFYHL